MKNIMNELDGIFSLAGVLQSRTKAISARPSVIDLGEIQEDGSLLTNKFPVPIPKTDYLCCRSVMWGGVGEICACTSELDNTNIGVHGHEFEEVEGHFHTVDLSVDGDDYCGNTSMNQVEMTKILENQGHIHDIVIGERQRSLKAGDRVLVVWIDSGDPCVVDIIYSADVELEVIYG